MGGIGCFYPLDKNLEILGFLRGSGGAKEALITYRSENPRSLDCAELPKDGNSASLGMTKLGA